MIWVENIIQMTVGLFAGMIGFAGYAFGLAFILFIICGGGAVIVEEIYNLIKNRKRNAK